MARPSVLHDGFLIPNANDVTNPRMAEPDRVDFSTLAHPLWGVIEGCLVTVAGSTASTQGGTLLVNGALVTLKAGSVGLGIGGEQDRFDLVVAGSNGILAVIVGTPSTDPVFPDPPLDTTVLAAVFCTPGAGSLVDNVIDKRKFISKALLTKIGVGEDLIRNANGSGNYFRVDGGGAMWWAGDTRLFRASPGKLSIEEDLGVKRNLVVGRDITASGSVDVGGTFTSSNLQSGTGTLPSAGDNADIYQDRTTGKLYVRRNNAWQELATTQMALPPGTVITSLEKPSVMTALGWIPLDGHKVYEADAPNLFDVQGMQHLIVNDSPRYIQLPNAQKLAMIVDWDRNAGIKVSNNVNNLVTLALANMPRHGHNPRSSPAGAANPTITVNRAGVHSHYTSGGGHTHAVEDPGHSHNGGEWPAASFVCLVWGGQNKIDALFNDRNHTYSVEATEFTKPSLSNVSVTAEWSEHYHNLDPSGEHDHIATIDGIDDHEHAVVEDLAGNGASFDITPEYLTVYSYVRS